MVVFVLPLCSVRVLPHLLPHITCTSTAAKHTRLPLYIFLGLPGLVPSWVVWIVIVRQNELHSKQCGQETLRYYQRPARSRCLHRCRSFPQLRGGFCLLLQSNTWPRQNHPLLILLHPSLYTLKSIILLSQSLKLHSPLFSTAFGKCSTASFISINTVLLMLRPKT